MRKAIVNQASNLVENIILIEEGAKWDSPKGTDLVDVDAKVEIGGTLKDGEFVKAPFIRETRPSRGDVLKAKLLDDTADLSDIREMMRAKKVWSA